MTKNTFKAYCQQLGLSARYSGNLRIMYVRANGQTPITHLNLVATAGMKSAFSVRIVAEFK